MEKRPFDENYSANQCALMLRMDGEEMYIPLDFGRSMDEVRAIYPYLLEMFQSRIRNPALKFDEDVKAGRYDGMPEKEYRERLERVKRASMLFYNRSDENLLAVAIRFAVDMKLRGVDELYWLFEAVTPPERIRAEALDHDEAGAVLEEHRVDHPSEKARDTGGEVDVAPGIGGSLGVDICGVGSSADPFSEVLDGLEAEQPMEDRFREIAEGSADPGRYESRYEKGRALPEDKVKGGLLHIYEDGAPSVFDELDRRDGIDVDGPAPDLGGAPEDVPQSPDVRPDDDSLPVDGPAGDEGGMLDGDDDDDGTTVPFGSVADEDDASFFGDDGDEFSDVPPDGDDGEF